MAGIKLTHIPYKGSSPALTDLIGGHVAIYFSSLPPAIALVREGKVRALAVTGPKRVGRAFPICRPSPRRRCRATRPCCITASSRRPARRGRSSTSSMPRSTRRSPRREVREHIVADGAEPLPGTPEDYAADIDREETKWSKIVKVSGAKVE